MKPILVCCGEASGDLLAGGVIRAIKAREPDRPVVALGGVHCRAAGADTFWDVKELSVMGIAEVVPKLWHILKLMGDVAHWAEETRPEAALLIDAPDFNLRLAKRLKRSEIRVVSYVSPSVWAWRQSRVKTIARRVDELCCILPFEEEWLQKRGVNARFVGHPLLEHDPVRESVQELRHELLAGGEGPLLAILPGSRRAEVSQLLPDMLGAARILTAAIAPLEVAIPVAPTIDRAMIERIAERVGFMPKLIDGRARELLSAADAALVASGTATLEAALAKVPSVVAYRVPLLTELVFRLFVRTPHVALPNIIAGRMIVPELLQRALSPESLAVRALPLLTDTAERRTMVEALRSVRDSLGTPGASERVATAVLPRVLQAAPSGPQLQAP